ncbi:FHA domain-containing protein [Permianibacter sp. IMCC34836]|uniref:FHA domain-containing protein n=1 Tax=Permianibacter fluminis TaxID=2738515 RepID=UPI001557B85B|nr:FHA domain-containing protein [Permianibacter fluminis]NQD37177.1 FHA domain-containing protein [Permianibacter fluminis]
MPYIQHLFNGAIVGHHQLTDRMTIGRHADNDIIIDDATVSGHHAVIEKMAYGYQIRDLDSTNGLRVHGEKTSLHKLQPDEVIIIGTHTLALVDNLPDSLQHTLKIKKSWIPGMYYTTD